MGDADGTAHRRRDDRWRARRALHGREVDFRGVGRHRWCAMTGGGDSRSVADRSAWDVNLLGADFRKQPFGRYAAMRACGKAGWNRRLGLFLLLGYDESKPASPDPGAF